LHIDVIQKDVATLPLSPVFQLKDFFFTFMFFCKPSVLWVYSHRCSMEIFLNLCLFCGLQIAVFAICIFQSCSGMMAFLASPNNYDKTHQTSLKFSNCCHRSPKSAVCSDSVELRNCFRFFLLSWPEKYSSKEQRQVIN